MAAEKSTKSSCPELSLSKSWKSLFQSFFPLLYATALSFLLIWSIAASIFFCLLARISFCTLRAASFRSCSSFASFSESSPDCTQGMNSSSKSMLPLLSESRPLKMIVRSSSVTMSWVSFAPFRTLKMNSFNSILPDLSLSCSLKSRVQSRAPLDDVAAFNFLFTLSMMRCCCSFSICAIRLGFRNGSVFVGFWRASPPSSSIIQGKNSVSKATRPSPLSSRASNRKMRSSSDIASFPIFAAFRTRFKNSFFSMLPDLSLSASLKIFFQLAPPAE
mmetsp:Transcript_29786/g.54564  ORF Transcript_29786/g.54564 Transcript_29786/m.54564 type:complete len:275 (-) Transcript_29786:9-833(-)